LFIFLGAQFDLPSSQALFVFVKNTLPQIDCFFMCFNLHFSQSKKESNRSVQEWEITVMCYNNDKINDGKWVGINIIENINYW
jgi:hypothetical protein